MRIFRAHGGGYSNRESARREFARDGGRVTKMHEHPRTSRVGLFFLSSLFLCPVVCGGQQRGGDDGLGAL